MNVFKLLTGAAAVALIAGTPALAADLIIDVPMDEPVAVADTGWYLSVFGGGVWASAEADDGDQIFDFDADLGWTFGVAAGAQITDFLRGEIEASTGSVGLTDVTITGYNPVAPAVTVAVGDGSASATYLLGNLWVDLDTGSGFTPYIGGGLGVAYISADGSIPAGPGATAAIDLAGWGWAYQVGAGVKVDVADNIALDLGYRFKGVVDAELEGPVNDAIADLGSHVVQAGLTFGF